MKKLNYMKIICLYAILFVALLLQSCGGNSGEPTLNSTEDLASAKELFIEKFNRYDNQLTSVRFGTDSKRENIIDVISVQFIKDGKPFYANYTRYTDVKESENTAKLSNTNAFSINDVNLSALTTALEKAKTLISKKDKMFYMFRIESAAFEMDSNKKMNISFDVIAKNSGLSYFGKRVNAIGDDFEFSFTLQDGIVVAYSGLDL